MRRWTAEEKTALVQQYVALPHGTKAAWLLEQGVSRHQIMTWRKAFYFGDLERDLVPRDTSHMTVADGARLARVEQELAAERAAARGRRRRMLSRLRGWRHRTRRWEKLSGSCTS